MREVDYKIGVAFEVILCWHGFIYTAYKECDINYAKVRTTVRGM